MHALNLLSFSGSLICFKGSYQDDKNGPIKLVSVFQHTYLEVMGSNPVTGKKNSAQEFDCSHEGMIPNVHANFPISFPYKTTCSV